jgi:HptB-dependent secretion and biofilm anti anti-sigma factor
MSPAEIILLPKRFDYSYHHQFDERYTPLLENANCKVIVLDFSEVEYLDSSALGMMVLLQNRFAGNDRQLKIKDARGATLDILTVAHMQKIFEFIS